MKLNEKAVKESLIKEWFGDTCIEEIIPEKNKLTIIFNMDAAELPGKPFGVLILKNPTNYKEIISSQKDMAIILRELVITKKVYGEKSWPVVMMETINTEPDYFEIPCEDFSYERIDDYKKKH